MLLRKTCVVQRAPTLYFSVIRLLGLGNAVSSLSGDRVEVPAANRFLCISSSKIAFGSDISIHFYAKQMTKFCHFGDERGRPKPLIDWMGASAHVAAGNKKSMLSHSGRSPSHQLFSIFVSAYWYIATTTLPIIAVFLEYLRHFLIDFNQIYRHSSVPKTRLRAFFELFSSSGFRARRRRDFLRATAYMLSAHMLSQFRLSVRPSVTRVIHAKTAKVRIMQFSPYSSPIHTVFAR